MPRITISEPGKTPQPYRLKPDRELTTIGRGSDNDVILVTGSASTHHCEMKKVEGGFILVDTKSTNGIKIEDTRYSVIDLDDGMTVHIGEDIEFSFELSDAEIETLEEEDFYPRQKAMFPKAKTKKKKKVEVDEEDLDDDDDLSSFDQQPEEEEEREEKVKKKPRKKVTAVSLDDDEDEDDEEEDSRPKLKRASGSSRSSSRPVASATAKTAGPAGLVLFLVLAAVFFIAGLAIRHYQDLDTFIFSK